MQKNSCDVGGACLHPWTAHYVAPHGLHCLCDATCTLRIIMLETKQRIQYTDVTNDGGARDSFGSVKRHALWLQVAWCIFLWSAPGHAERIVLMIFIASILGCMAPRGSNIQHTALQVASRCSTAHGMAHIEWSTSNRKKNVMKYISHIQSMQRHSRASCSSFANMLHCSLSCRGTAWHAAHGSE
jgi:hypothetical protein